MVWWFLKFLGRLSLFLFAYFVMSLYAFFVDYKDFRQILECLPKDWHTTVYGRED